MRKGVILDTNCFSHVFNKNDKRHNEFTDVLDWVCSGPGHLVYGGSKYLEELKKTKKYLKIFSILREYNKAELCCSDKVDEEMLRIIKLVNDANFDDPHLAAIVIVSGSRIICTSDTRSFTFLKRKDIYDGRGLCPKFYTGNNCLQLLSSPHIERSRRLNKKELQRMMTMLNSLVES